MNAPFSSYLTRIAPGLKELIAKLRQRYDYVSVLSTDTIGFQTAISQRAKSVTRETLCTERGTVVRVYRNGQYAESAFTGFDPAKAAETAEAIIRELDSQLALLQECGTGIVAGQVAGFGTFVAVGNAEETAVGVVSVESLVKVALGEPLFSGEHLFGSAHLAGLEVPFAQSENGQYDHQDDGYDDDKGLLILLNKLFRTGDDIAHFGVLLFNLLFHYYSVFFCSENRVQKYNFFTN